MSGVAGNVEWRAGVGLGLAGHRPDGRTFYYVPDILHLTADPKCFIFVPA